MAYLLDTNTCIRLMRKSPHIVRRVGTVAPGDCSISTITSYELYTGVAKRTSPDVEKAKVALLLATVREIPCDTAAAEEAGRLRAALESQGNMIGPYDVLLAAQAIVYGLTLVTANTREFTRIAGLVVENWEPTSA